MNKAFTLIEVAIAGSLIGLCVLSAVSIIPHGLQNTNEARMRAAASAAIITLSAKGGLAGCMNPTNVTPSPVVIGAGFRFDSSGAIATPPSTLWAIPTTPGAGELERRLVFSFTTGGNNGAGLNTRSTDAWLLSADPDNSPKNARYLATFTEFQP